MRVALLNDSKQGLGGAWSFLRNLTKGLESLGHQVVDNPLEAQIAVLSGVTMVNRDTVRAVKEGGVKLVVRVDNLPRNSRNRNTGTSRLKDFTEWADEVVWQCAWAREYLGDFVKREGVIIYNGVDIDVFNPEGVSKDYRADGSGPIYLYSRYSRDENKRYEEAWYEYQLIHQKNPNAKLVLAGRFSPEHAKYNFDFFRGEKVESPIVAQTPEEMAMVYRGCDYLMAPYFCDAYSNTYLEAIACGLELYKPSMTGGTPELIRNGVITIQEMAKEYEKLFEKLLVK